MRTPGARDSVDVLSVAIFDLIFEYHNAGYAAAMAFILFVVILTLTGIGIAMSYSASAVYT